MNFKDMSERKVLKCVFKEICKYRDGGCEDDHILLTLGCPHREETSKLVRHRQRQNEFDHPGFKRISELARHDNIVHHFLMMFGNGQISWDEVKTEMILHMSKYNKETMDRMNKLIAHSPPPMYIMNKDFI